VYTVQVSFREHVLVPEPFVLVAWWACESATTRRWMSGPEKPHERSGR
jgi:hypothetical protein